MTGGVARFQLGANHALDVFDADKDVLGLQIGVDDAADPVHVIQTQQNLLRDLLDDRGRDALGLVPLDESQEVLAEHLEDHADVRSVGALVLEVVEEGDDVVGSWVRLFESWGFDEPLEELDLVQSGLGVAWCGLDDFKRNVTVHPT